MYKPAKPLSSEELLRRKKKFIKSDPEHRPETAIRLSKWEGYNYWWSKAYEKPKAGGDDE